MSLKLRECGIFSRSAILKPSILPGRSHSSASWEDLHGDHVSSNRTRTSPTFWSSFVRASESVQTFLRRMKWPGTPGHDTVPAAKEVWTWKHCPAWTTKTRKPNFALLSESCWRAYLSDAMVVELRHWSTTKNSNYPRQRTRNHSNFYILTHQSQYIYAHRHDIVYWRFQQSSKRRSSVSPRSGAPREFIYICFCF